MRHATTVCEIAGAACAVAGTVALFWLSLAAGLLATAALCFGASWVLQGVKR